MNVQQAENKMEYLKKMNRQLTESDMNVARLENIAHDRQADKNEQLKKQLETLRYKLDLVHRQIDSLSDQPEEGWADEAREVSQSFKELEGLVETASAHLKRK